MVHSDRAAHHALVAQAHLACAERLRAEEAIAATTEEAVRSREAVKDLAVRLDIVEETVRRHLVYISHHEHIGRRGVAEVRQAVQDGAEAAAGPTAAHPGRSGSQ